MRRSAWITPDALSTRWLSSDVLPHIAIEPLMLAPLTPAAVCSPGEILQMVEEMFEAEREYLPGF